MPSWTVPANSVYRDVEARVREWAKAQTGSFDVWEPRWRLADQVSGSKNNGGSLNSTYCSQVLRALSTFVEEGWLIKVGERRDARYMSHEAKRAQDERDRLAAEEARATMARWDKTREALTGHGFQPRGLGRSIELSLEEWELLTGKLDVLEEGQR